MADFSSPRYLLAFFLLILYLKAMDADPNLTFSFNNFGGDSRFGSHLALFGDAVVSGDNASVRISGSGGVGSGRFFCRKPFNLVEGKSGGMVSFSNHFVFSMSGENGDGLAFVMLPFGAHLDGFSGGSMGVVGERKLKFLAVEFDTFKDEKYGDMNGNHVGIDVESFVSVKASNVSSVGLVLNGGEKLQAWIDYEASGKRFEVRLSKLGGIRPLDPLLSYPIDLSKMWKDEDVRIGLSSSSGNSSQKCSVYSWSFKSRTMPHWMHSQPMNPEGVLRLIQKPTKRWANWKDELNLDTLADLGPQWWAVRVSRVTGQEIAERMARAMARNFPDMEFMVYVPSVQIKRKLKNGTLSIKPKPLFPGCVFLRCALNKELHDFIRECPGVGGFVGSKVGNVRRQINKPKPVDKDDVEAMFKQAKEEQEKADQAFEEAEQEEKALDSKKLGIDSKKPGGRGRKAGKTTSLKLGSTVQVSSGSFAGFSAPLKSLIAKRGWRLLNLHYLGRQL